MNPTRRLRPQVELTLREGGAELLDRDTGLSFSLEGDCAFLEGGGETDAETWELLSGLGLLDEGLTLEQVRARQAGARGPARERATLERVRELLGFAVERVPYYRERRAEYEPGRVEALADLEKLPLLRKADLRAQFPAGIVADGVDLPQGMADGELAIATTSGTTGERLQVVSDLTLHAYPPEFDALWALGELEPLPKTAVFTSPTCLGTQCHLGQRTYEERLVAGNTLFLNSTEDLFSLKRELVLNLAEELDRLRPTFLLANPIYLHWLGRRAREWGVALARPKVILSSYQYLPSASRRALGELFGAPVFDYWAASDLGGSRGAVECRRGRLHVRGDHSHVEVLAADGRAAPPGALGTLAVTTLASRVMPLVRYLVGDYGRLTGEECDCEAADWPCLELHGRTKDLLRLGGRWVTTREVDQALASVDAIDFWRCTQVGERELVVHAVPAPGRTIDAHAVSGALASRFGPVEVRLKTASRLEPEPSMKYRLTECRIATPPELP